MKAHNVVVALDSFKGSIDARSACEAVADGLRSAGVSGVMEMPVADGGEGLIDALTASGFEAVEARVLLLAERSPRRGRSGARRRLWSSRRRRGCITWVLIALPRSLCEPQRLAPGNY